MLSGRERQEDAEAYAAQAEEIQIGVVATVAAKRRRRETQARQALQAQDVAGREKRISWQDEEQN